MGNKGSNNKQTNSVDSNEPAVPLPQRPPLYDPVTPAFAGTIEPFANVDANHAGDILRVVLKFLSFRSAARVSLVCKDFNGIVRDSEDFWESTLAHLYLYHDSTAKPMLQLVYDADKSVTAQNRSVEHKGNDSYKLTREFFQYQSLQQYKSARETVIAFATNYNKLIQANWNTITKQCQDAQKRMIDDPDQIEFGT